VEFPQQLLVGTTSLCEVCIDERYCSACSRRVDPTKAYEVLLAIVSGRPRAKSTLKRGRSLLRVLRAEDVSGLTSILRHRCYYVKKSHNSVYCEYNFRFIVKEMQGYYNILLEEAGERRQLWRHKPKNPGSIFSA
jgi:hypothetical protein